MRKLIGSLAVAGLLAVGLSACDRYAPEDAWGHCVQSSNWSSGGYAPLGNLNVTRAYRFRFNDDWLYHCEGYDPLARPPWYSFCMRWNTHYADGDPNPHDPKNISLCPTPA